MPYLTVLENIKLAGDKTAGKTLIAGYLEKCSLSPLQNKYPSELSVGEKQRTAFIRAIISKPEMLLADEPTGNLDPENSRILMELMEEYRKNGGTVILVSHQPEISGFTSGTINLESGKLR